MENANSYEYLEKIKIAVIENLKRTAAVPSVQMQDVPRQGLGMSDEEEAELDDLDADMNKDARMTQRQWEKSTVRPEDALYESDDDDMAAANGVYKNGKTRRSILDHPNPHADVEMDSGVASPVRNGNGVPAQSIEPADDTMVDDTAAEVQSAAKPEASPKANGDGDVDMVDATEPAPDPTVVKSEEAEGDAQTSQPTGDSKPPATEVLPVPPASAGVVSAEVATKQADGDKEAADHPATEDDRMETDETPAKPATAESTDAAAPKSPSKA
jgi:histone deacetylase 1/2